MSDVLDAEAADAGDEIDLTGVPMDDADGGEGGAAEGDQGEGEGDVEAQARAPLPPEELQRRYENTRVALQQERRERREERQTLERRLAALESGGHQQQRRQVDLEEEIDPDVDPLGAIKQMRATIKAYQDAERREGETEAQRQARERAYSQVESDLQEHEADYRELHPDYDQAAKHYAQARAQDLGMIGLSPQQIAATLREEFIALAQRAIQGRKNPAAVVYELAKRHGYQKGATPPAEQRQARDQNGKFTKLDTLRSGQRATSPLGKGGGRANPGLDARTVGSINIRDRKGGEAFDKAFAALERQARAAER